MIIEIKKKHVLIAVTGILLGFIIGLEVFSLFYKTPQENNAPKELPTTQVQPAEQTANEVVQTPAVTEEKTNSPSNDVETLLYKNYRYGFSIQYPSTWIKGTPPSNGDGGEFFSEDKSIIMSVAGSNKIPQKTIENSYYDSLQIAKSKGILGFHMLSDNWYVITYTDGDYIYYQKSFVGPNSMNTLYIQSWASKNDEYQGIIEQLEATFKHGDLDKGH